jgi:hypothetical protein
LLTSARTSLGLARRFRSRLLGGFAAMLERRLS